MMNLVAAQKTMMKKVILEYLNDYNYDITVEWFLKDHVT